MKTFETWLAQSPLGGAFKAFIAVVLAAAVADFLKVGDISLANWETWVIAGLASAAPMVINWLNPKDSRYGKIDSAE